MAEENQQVATTNGVDHSIASSSHSNEQIVQTLLQLQTQTPTPTLAEGSSVNGSSAPSANVEEQQPSPTPVVPQTEWDILRAQLKQKPHDPDGWNRLVGLAESSGDLQKIKETYEGLLEVYPNTASAQIAYVRHFLVPGNLVEGEVIFKRFMLASPPPPDVEFWKYYIEHVRRVNVGPEKRESIRKAYDYALNHIGQDKDSGDTWMSYIMFLRAGETKSPWEEGQKMDALRKVYHRAVQIPLENIEAIWSEYEAFERNLNAITAKKFMADLSPSYMQARGVLRQLQQHLRPLFPPPPPPPTLYLPAKPTFSNAERALVGQWKNYLRWEESNPLEIEEAQRTTLIARIQSVYRKAVIRMRFYGEIWYMAYQWTNSVGKTAEAMNILKAGHEANPTSFVLNFALAESHELAQRFEEVHQLYTRLLEALRVDLEAIDAQVAEEKANEAQQGSQESQPDNTQNSLLSQVSLAAMPKPLDSKKPHDERLRERKREYGVVWINYMRFALRAEGQQAARTVFGKARRDPYTPWQVYQAAALREYHSTREPTVATKIYAKGLELFGSEADFVVHYLSFLLSVNDENNARAVFEQVINNFEPEEARPIWERWARHQYQYGDLASSLSIEQRMAAVYPNDRPIKRFAQRHTFDNIDVIANRDLGLAAARQASAGSSPTQNQGHSQSQPQSQTQGEAKGPTPLARTSTQQSLGNERERAPSRDRGAAGKRAASPDYKRREEAYGNKRARQSSPPPREWRDHGPGSSRRRHNSPGWDHRERSRERERKHKEEEDKVQLPSVLSWFIGSLPPPSSFDGPIFRTDDLMQVFRNAVIPSVTGRARSPPPPPPPPRGNTRPPPDYSPYQGPGGPRGRRY